MSTPHDHSHDSTVHEHEHEHEQHEHAHPDDHPHDHDHSGHGHSHPSGIKGFFYGLFVPHTHDAADSIDDALEASSQGVRALKISLFVLLGTTILQFLIFLISGSVALLADSIHNFSDALTAVPLWIAFVLGRRIATRRYTYGFGRAEDLAGLFIVAVVALSAIVAAWESINRLFHPQSLHNLWFVAAAGLIGFAGNALVADGVHARLDGFTSLAVVLGAIGVMLGFPLADPIIGIIISAAIIVLLWGTTKSIGRRLMDGIEPELVDRARHALEETPGVISVPRIQLRWVGHRLQGAATIHVPDAALSVVEGTVHHAQHNVEHALPNLDDLSIRAVTTTRPDHHFEPEVGPA
jgi:cation diffusion facilitator family transporter